MSITITTGGTYSGTYTSTSTATPAVTIATTAAVTLDGATISHAGRGITDSVTGVNLTVRNCTITRTDPGGLTDNDTGRAILLQQPASVVVENNLLERGNGIWLGGPKTMSGLRVRYNRCINVGYWGVSNCCIQFFQADGMVLPGADIGWNHVSNDYGSSQQEDAVNLYITSGASGNPILVHHNLIDGAYAASGNGAGYTGGGLMGGDSGGSWITFADNWVVGTSNYGVGIVGGHDNTITRNWVVNDAYAEPGHTLHGPDYGQGLTVWDASNAGGMTNIVVTDNTSGWVRRTAGGGTERANWWLPAATTVSGNTALADPIDTTDEQAARDAWDAARVAAGVVVGPITTATVHYVDNAATGTNTGASWANAWTSFAAIAWGSVAAGDTIYISGGSTSKTYQATLTIGASGTAGNLIHITRGVDAGHDGTPIIDGQQTRADGVNNGDGGTARSYVKVSRLSVRNHTTGGFAYTATTGCVIEDNDILCGTGSGSPRGLDLRDNTSITVRGNRVTTPASTTGQTDGIYLLRETSFLVEGNDVDISNTDTTGGSDALQVDTCYAGTVRGNILRSPTAGAANHPLWIAATQTGTTIDVYNNVCHARGGQINTTYTRATDGDPNGTVRLFNNTCYGGSRALNLARVANLIARNNILWPDSGGTGWYAATTDPAAANVTYNLVWAPGGTVAVTVAGGTQTWTQWIASGANANGVNADPAFTTPGSDFTLQATSPAVDAGTSLATVATDLLGVTRPQGSAYDVGAYELQPTGVAQITERALAGATTDTGTTGAQTLSVTPTGMQAGDMLLALFASGGGTVTHTGPAGWTQIGTTAYSSGIGLSVWRKFAGTGEAGPYQFDVVAASNRRLVLAVRAWTGVNPASPLDASALGTAANTTSITHAASTSVGSGRLWLLATAKGTAAAGTSTITTPTGFTQHVERCTTHAVQYNVDAAVHSKLVGSGSTGTQQVTSGDVDPHDWSAVSVLLMPAGAGVATGQAAAAQTLALSASATVISAAATTVGTVASQVMGGGFQNCGTFAPLGVGHAWYAASGADDAGMAMSVDGITWKPSTKGIASGGQRMAAVEGSRTTANRLYALASTNADGTGSGYVYQGTYNATTGLAAWTIIATLSDGPAAGGNTQPRQVGRLLALDEANDTLYAATRSGLYRVTISTGATSLRALSGEDVTGIILNPGDAQIGYATCDAAAANPGVVRLTNLRSGTVGSTRYATLTNPQDLVWLSAGATDYVYVAAMAQGVRRWTVSGDITTGWTDLTNNYNFGANACAAIDAAWTGTVTKLLAANAGMASSTNAGAYSNDGGTTWANQTGWTISYVPWGETQNWWLLSRPFGMLDGSTYDCMNARIDPSNTAIMQLWGRAGTWRSHNGGGTWRPSVRGLCVTIAWTCMADPTNPTRGYVGDGDWGSIFSTGGFTSGMPQQELPSTEACFGIAFRGDTGKCALAFGSYLSNSAGEIFTSTNPFAASPTWSDNGFSATASGHACMGVAIGENASGSEVILTVRQATGIQRKVGANAPVTVSTGPDASGDSNMHFCWPDGHLGRQWVYLSGEDGFWMSDDHGATWNHTITYTNNNRYTGSMDYDPAFPNTVYLTRNDGTVAGSGLFKITGANTQSPTITKIGPVMDEPGACAVDHETGVVYFAVRNSESGNNGEARLYASPGANPGAGTTFTDITDPQWASGPFGPRDMTVLGNGSILVANVGGYYVSSQVGTVVRNAIATADHAIALTASATVVSQVAAVINAAATITLAHSVNAAAVAPPAQPAAPAVEPGFNGQYWPKVTILAGFLGQGPYRLDPGPEYLHLGVGPGLGTARLGGIAYVDISEHVRAVSISRGRDSDLDTANPGTATIELDNRTGRYDPLNAASPYVVDAGVPVKVLAEWPLGTRWPLFAGQITSIALDPRFPDPIAILTCTDALETLGRAQLPEVAAPLGEDDLSGARVHRLADLAGWPTNLRSIDAGYTRLAATTLGASALELLRAAEQTEFGLLYANAAGWLVFYDRHRATTATRSVTVQAHLTDLSDPGDIGMIELEISHSWDQVFNRARITRTPKPGEDGDEPVEQAADNPTSQAIYGVLSFGDSVGTLLRTDGEAAAMAQYLVTRFATPQTRIASVRVNTLRADATGTTWDTLLGLELLDRIRVRRDYGGGSVIDAELLIQGIRIDIGADPIRWDLTLATSPPPPTPALFRLGSGALGVNRLGW